MARKYPQTKKQFEIDNLMSLIYDQERERKDKEYEESKSNEEKKEK